MKKATLGSTAVWAGAAAVIIISGQIWPMASNRLVDHVMTWVALGFVVASVGLMRDVPVKDLLWSSLNSNVRNLLNIANFVAAVAAALALGYLSDLFVRVDFNSSTFKVAVVLLIIGVFFQAFFTIVTAPRVQK